MKSIVNKMKFNSDGLIPAIVQEHKTGEVLMLAYMNNEAFKRTMATKKVHFYSRSRKKLWCKGGNLRKHPETKRPLPGL